MPCSVGLLMSAAMATASAASTCTERCASRGVAEVLCKEICATDPTPASVPQQATKASAEDGGSGRAPAIAPDKSLPAVSVKGASSDNAARRPSVAGRITIDRQAIDASGSSTVEQVLRKEPAITISADGRLGLMGLPGYTTFLLDGGPPPNAKGVLDLDLTQVERIEIIKSASAETGAFGIAGTVNVVTRRIVPQAEQQLRLNAGGGGLDSSYRAAWSLNRPAGTDSFGYSARASASRRKQEDAKRESLARGDSLGSWLPHWQGSGASESVKEHLNASSTLRWSGPERSKLELSPSVTVLRSGSEGYMAYAASSVGSPPIEAFQERGHSLLSSYSGDVLWSYETEQGVQLEVQWLPVLMREHAQAQQDLKLGAMPDRYADQYTGRTHQQTLRLRADGEMRRGHNLKAGAEVSTWDSDRDLRFEVNGQPDLSLMAFGATQGEHSKRWSGYMEYDGKLTAAFAVNAGLRHERQLLLLNEGANQVRTRYALLSPSLHASYKLDEAGKRQVRASLARTFNAPFSDQLRQRPTQINALAACTPGQLCGANTADLPDSAGNPGLRPEQSLGINISIEQQWGRDSRVRVELFSRSIKDVFITETRLQPVPWASVPRYVSRPENRGHAEVRGLGVESSLRLTELDAAFPNFMLRTGLNWARSWLSEVPGPDNRFAGQNPWSAKFGLDYAPAGAKWDLSFNASASPSGWVRNASKQRYFESRRSEFSAESSWAQSKDLKWRLALRNLVPRDRTRIDEFERPAQFTQRSVVKRSASSIALTAELKM